MTEPSILNQTTDLKGNPKAVWMYPSKPTNPSHSFNRYEKDKENNRLSRAENMQDYDLGWHGGNLKGYAESPYQPWTKDYQEGDEVLTSGVVGDSVPFTGHYFYSDRKSAASRGHRYGSKGNGEHYAVDFGKYNMYRPYSSSTYFYLISLLRNPSRYGDDSLRGQAFWTSVVDGMIHYCDKDSYARHWLAGFSSLLKKSRNNVIEALTKGNKYKKLGTTILEAMGFEGIDVRNVKVEEGEADPNSGQWGSVIFDIKPNTVMHPEDIRKQKHWYKDEEEEVGHTSNKLMIKHACDEGWYLNAVQDGRMSAQDAIEIIKSAKLPIPSGLEQMALSESIRLIRTNKLW